MKNKNWQEILLAPLSFIYAFVVWIRNEMFNREIWKAKKFSVPIVSVGNLTAGGTGKTPVTAQIVELLKAQGKKVAIVSRGYKGKYTEKAIQVDMTRSFSARIFGDEPTWFAQKLQVPVIVGRRRCDAIELALQQKPDVVVADDGFQHRWFQRNCDVVLLDVTESSKLFLPAGRWREPLSSLGRAKIVVLTKTNLVHRDELSLWEEAVADYGFFYTNGNLFKADYRIENVLRVHGSGVLVEKGPILLGSSIARPESFRRLMEQSYTVARHWVLPDHGVWTQTLVDEIEKWGSDHGVENLVVTEKDFTKLQALQFLDLNIWVTRLSLNWEPSLQAFQKTLLDALHNNSSS